MSKESVYDSEIAPLMTQIIAVCRGEKIAMLADFNLDDDLRVTTSLLLEEFCPTSAQLQAMRLLQPRPRHFVTVGIS